MKSQNDSTCMRKRRQEKTEGQESKEKMRREKKNPEKPSAVSCSVCEGVKVKKTTNTAAILLAGGKSPPWSS